MSVLQVPNLLQETAFHANSLKINVPRKSSCQAHQLNKILWPSPLYLRFHKSIRLYLVVLYITAWCNKCLRNVFNRWWRNFVSQQESHYKISNFLSCNDHVIFYQYKTLASSRLCVLFNHFILFNLGIYLWN